MNPEIIDSLRHDHNYIKIKSEVGSLHLTAVPPSSPGGISRVFAKISGSASEKLEGEKLRYQIILLQFWMSLLFDCFCCIIDLFLFSDIIIKTALGLQSKLNLSKISSNYTMYFGNHQCGLSIFGLAFLFISSIYGDRKVSNPPRRDHKHFRNMNGK